MHLITADRVITMTGEEKDYDAILFNEDGVIEEVGYRKDLEKKAESVDVFKGTIIPGFIDPHSHIVAFSSTLSLCHLDGSKNFEEIRKKILDYKNTLDDPKYLVAFGYDNNDLEEKRHPDRLFLDSISPDLPLIVTHKSGHVGVLNTLALEMLGIDKNTKTPQGGKIGYYEDGSLSGYLEETAFTSLLVAMPKEGIKEKREALKRAEKTYLSYGITTSQEGKASEEEIEILKGYEGDLDIIFYVDLTATKDFKWEDKKTVHLGGYKAFLDGSPQARTAWMKTPYLDSEDYKGYPVLTDEEVKAFMKKAVEDKRQILFHANGDEAALQMIRCAEQTEGIEKIHPVMVHAQLLDIEDMERLKKSGILVTFFPAHVYHWGDTHIRNFGLERAGRISPMKSAIEKGINATMHQDTPVLMPDMIESIHIAVNRTTRDGMTLGKDEALDVYTALKCATVNGARQYGLEDRGTLEKGKLCDLAILSEDMTKIEKERIRDIRVLATVKRGKVVFTR